MGEMYECSMGMEGTETVHICYGDDARTRYGGGWYGGRSVDAGTPYGAWCTN